MKKRDVKKEIKNIVCRICHIGPEQLDPDTVLEDVGIDSFMFLEIIAAIEKKYRIFIKDDDFTKVKTLKDIYKIADNYIT